jgi:hypothetical protein
VGIEPEARLWLYIQVHLSFFEGCKRDNTTSGQEVMFIVKSVRKARQFICLLVDMSMEPVPWLDYNLENGFCQVFLVRILKRASAILEFCL